MVATSEDKRWYLKQALKELAKDNGNDELAGYFIENYFGIALEEGFEQGKELEEIFEEAKREVQQEKNPNKGSDLHSSKPVKRFSLPLFGDFKLILQKGK